MSNIIEINNLKSPELSIFSMLTEAQMRNKLHPEQGIFLVESPKVIEVALATGYEPVAMLIENKFVDKQAKNIIEQCPTIPIYTADEHTLASITGYHLTKGMICAMRLPTIYKTMEEVCHSARRIVVMDDIANVTNEGAIFRSAAALGIDGVLLTRRCCTPLNRRTVRVSMGTVFQLPWAFIGNDINDWPTFGMAKLHEMGFKTVAMALSDDSVNINDPKLLAEKRLAIVMGTEGDGLPKTTIAACDYVARIPMQRNVDSLNVAAASAVAFWQLCN